MKMSSQSIKSKILVTQISQIFVVVVLLGLTSYTLFSEQHTQEELEQLANIAQWNAQCVEHFFDDKKQLLEQIAESEEVEQYSIKYQMLMLQKYFARFHKAFPSLTFVNSDGLEEVKITHGNLSDQLDNIKNSPVFQRAISHPNTSVLMLPQAPFTSESIIEFAFWRQNFFDESVGIVIGRIPLSELSNQLFKSERDLQSYVLLANTQGLVLAHNSPRHIGKSIPELTEFNQPLDQKIITNRISILNEDSFVAASVSPEYGIVSAAVYPAKTFLAPPKRMREHTIIFLVAFMGIAYVVNMIMASRLSNPIRQLSTITQEIATGNFDHRVKVTSKDEVGVLEQSFNDMVDHLQQSTTSIESLNHEIEQRVQAEAHQAELLHEIEATNKELKDFAHIVSHDLKAPLRGIRSIACWLEEDYAETLDEAGKQQLAMLIQRVERMKNLIEGILQYSRVGRTNEQVKPIDLNKTLPEIIDLLAVPDNMHITIAKKLPTVNFETTRLAQVFQNLLSNAIKYIDKPEGEINIDFTEDDDFWTFNVSDNGPGIDEKYFGKIFGIFQTLNARDEYESTGIGLAVIKRTVENAGGKIWVASELGKGSTFSFTVSKHLEVTPAPETDTPKPFILNNV